MHSALLGSTRDENKTVVLMVGIMNEMQQYVPMEMGKVPGRQDHPSGDTLPDRVCWEPEIAARGQRAKMCEMRVHVVIVRYTFMMFIHVTIFFLLFVYR